MTRIRLALTGAALALVAVVPSPATAAPLTGVHDDRAWQLSGRDDSLGDRTRDVRRMGARIFQTDLLWSEVARRRPKHPTDPGDPAYDWYRQDRAIRAARAAGLTVQLALYHTPRWLGGGAYGNAAPPLRDLRRFAVAAGRRYSGRYRPAPYAKPLPRVGRWIAWNEPNLELFLRPQFRSVGGRLVSASPRLYAGMLRAIRDGLRAGMRRQRAAAPIVAGGATAPKGDRRPSSVHSSHTPQRFMAELAAFHPRMAAWAHHSYPLGPPKLGAPRLTGPIDAWNVTALPRLLDRAGGTLSGLPVWITETGVPTERVRVYNLSFEADTSARVLGAMYHRAAASRRITEFVVYFLQDHPLWRTGLRDLYFRPKATWYAACDAFWRARGGRCLGPTVMGVPLPKPRPGPGGTPTPPGTPGTPGGGGSGGGGGDPGLPLPPIPPPPPIPPAPSLDDILPLP